MKKKLLVVYVQKKDEMAGGCGSQEGEKKCIHSFGRKTWWRETTWKT
jgi:hypothetical protein